MSSGVHILRYPHEVLFNRSLEISNFDEHVEKFCQSLSEAVKRTSCFAIAAPQLGASLRVFSARFVEEGVTTYVNPVIEAFDGWQDCNREGCLSLPSKRFDLKRADTITFSFQRPDGSTDRLTVSGVSAQIVQHEVDHLDGVTVVDRVREQLPSMNRQRRRVAERELASVK